MTLETGEEAHVYGFMAYWHILMVIVSMYVLYIENILMVNLPVVSYGARAVR